jgi:hypothetical protein
VSDDYERGAFSDSKTITLNAYNTTEATYSLNGEAPIEFSGETSIKLTYPDPNGTVTLDVEAAYNDYTISETFTYEKTNIQVDEVTVNHLETTPLKNKSVAAWVWPEGGDGQWVEGTLGDDVFTFNLPDGHTWFLLVTFPKGASNFNWDDALEQTGDFQVPNDGNFDGADLNWQ